MAEAAVVSFWHERSGRPATAGKLRAPSLPALLGGLNGFDDGVGVGPIARFEFGMEEFSIGVDFKSSAA